MFDDFKKSKIPYDDIPISRGTTTRFHDRPGERQAKFKILIALVIILACLNAFMAYVTLNYIKNGKVKEVNLNTYNITATENDAEAIAINEAKWSCVSIAAGGNFDELTNQMKGKYTSGSGVLFRIDSSSSGTDVYFVTCNHVISKYINDRIWIWLPSRLTPILASEVVGYSTRYDLAVIKYHTNSADVDANLEGCSAVKLFDTTYLTEGERIYAIGNPYSEGISIKSGIVSRVNKTINYKDGLNVIEIDAPINPGNSGGGLFNRKGEFIGIVQSKYETGSVSSSDSKVIVGMSFAVPGNAVAGIANSMISNGGNATQIDLGASFDTDTSLGKTKVIENVNGESKIIESEYVVVSDVSYNSDAYGYLKVGDIVKSMTFYTLNNGEMVQQKVKFYNSNIFEAYSFSIVNGTRITFEVDRKSTISSAYETQEISFTVSSLSSVE